LAFAGGGSDAKQPLDTPRQTASTSNDQDDTDSPTSEQSAPRVLLDRGRQPSAWGAGQRANGKTFSSWS
jgi:hypothetical protein